MAQTATARSVLAIDPGTDQSAFCLFDESGPVEFGTMDNYALLKRLRDNQYTPGRMLAVEMIASYGMPVGSEVFDTCVWIGRFIQAWSGAYDLVYRADVKLHICKSPRAKDPNVTQALRDRFGEKGTKKKPGKLYGIKNDEWAALAVAVTWWDTFGAKEAE